ncbi:MAG: hypothetical protein BME94_01935 [Methanobacteriales archaeon Met13]
MNNVTIQNNNQTGLIVNGDLNHVNGSNITGNRNGITINGTENNLTGNNIQNNNHTGVNISGNQNNLTQNNITGNRNGVEVKGTNNTLNYNRISQNSENNLFNSDNGTVNAQYNWWGRNTPTRISGPNIDASNYVMATQIVEGAGNGIINTGQTYNVRVRLADSQGKTLQMAIPSFLIQFYFDSGDVYPTTAIMANNTAQTQIQVFHSVSYSLRTVLDGETLVTNLKTPVNAQSMTPIKRTVTTDSGVGRYYCGPDTLKLLLDFLGFDTSIDELARLAGTTSSGITFYGMIQAAQQYGIQLCGVKLGSDQLKSRDIVLLNVNGYYHYSFVIQKFGNFIILQDPTYGVRILTLDEFNKIYTGYALTTIPEVGILLSDDLLKILMGGMAETVAGGAVATAASTSWFPPLAAAILLFAAVFIGGDYLLNKYAPNVVPYKGTGWNGIINDTLNLSFYLSGSLEDIFNRNPDVERGINAVKDGGIEGILVRIPTPKDGRDQIAKFVENISNLSTPYKIAGIALTLGTLPAYNFFKSLPPSARDSVITGIVQAPNSFNKNIIEPAIDKISIVKQEFQQSLTNQIKTKVQQTKTYVKQTASKVSKTYKEYIKPVAQKYIAPVAHKLLDPIVKTKTYQTIRNLPGIKQAVDGASWIARGLGIW